MMLTNKWIEGILLKLAQSVEDTTQLLADFMFFFNI
jgi:hypothetical protein